MATIRLHREKTDEPAVTIRLQDAKPKVRGRTAHKSFTIYGAPVASVEKALRTLIATEYARRLAPQNIIGSPLPTSK